MDPVVKSRDPSTLGSRLPLLNGILPSPPTGRTNRRTEGICSSAREMSFCCPCAEEWDVATRQMTTNWNCFPFPLLNRISQIYMEWFNVPFNHRWQEREYGQLASQLEPDQTIAFSIIQHIVTEHLLRYSSRPWRYDNKEKQPTETKSCPSLPPHTKNSTTIQAMGQAQIPGIILS